MNLPSLKTSILNPVHLKLGAKFTEFGGWSMPVMYTSIREEHEAVRNAAGLFDISHMGEVKISGASALSFLNSLLTNDIEKLKIGQGQYTFMLNFQGGVIDDLIVYRLGEEEFLLIVNASHIEENEVWILERLDSALLPPLISTGGNEIHTEKLSYRGTVRFENLSDQTGAMALQGPKAEEIAALVFGVNGTQLARNEIRRFSWRQEEILAARTGYTGEDGFEFFCKNEAAEAFCLFLLDVGRAHGLKPAALGARDTLRLEAGLPLNGQDLAPHRSPLEAGLGAFVSLTKTATFPGRGVLEKQKIDGTAEKLAAFRVLEGPPPRAHYPVFYGAEKVGEVTSGIPSPTLGHGLGFAYIRTPLTSMGTRLELEVRGHRCPIEIVKRPFYKRPV